MKSAIIVLLFLLLLGTIANAIYISPATGMVTRRLTGLVTPNCILDSDCPKGEVCKDRMCAPVPVEPVPLVPVRSISARHACETNDDCSRGFECKNNVCQLITRSVYCSSTVPCPEGKTCFRGRCIKQLPRPTPTQIICRVNNDCPRNHICYLNECIIPGLPVRCYEDAHCPSGNVCRDQRCFEVPEEETASGESSMDRVREYIDRVNEAAEEAAAEEAEEEPEPAEEPKTMEEIIREIIAKILGNSQPDEEEEESPPLGDGAAAPPNLSDGAVAEEETTEPPELSDGAAAPPDLSDGAAAEEETTEPPNLSDGGAAADCAIFSDELYPVDLSVPCTTTPWDGRALEIINDLETVTDADGFFFENKVVRILQLNLGAEAVTFLFGYSDGSHCVDDFPLSINPGSSRIFTTLPDGSSFPETYDIRPEIGSWDDPGFGFPCYHQNVQGMILCDYRVVDKARSIRITHPANTKFTIRLSRFFPNYGFPSEDDC